MSARSGNIVLIGMPGAGKSTVGVILAKRRARAFIDTDLLIQLDRKTSLQNIVDTQGHLALRAIEESILLGLACDDTVIATQPLTSNEHWTQFAVGELKLFAGGVEVGSVPERHENLKVAY